MGTSEKVIISQDIDFLLKRGVAEVIVEEEMAKLLRSGKKLRLKEGFDPSFPDIHLGHMVALRKLRQFQELGHQVILIVGDWTAQIGDPSGVSATRPMLSKEQVLANAETYMKQFFKVVDKKKTEVRWQSEWFGNFTLANVIQLTSKFTVAQLLARDDFNSRYNTGRPIAITELLYPLLQAYDSVAVQADVEFGGTDQKFNLLMGRELQSMEGQRPQQVFLVPLLVGTDGSQKMSKSLGNYIGVAEPPNEIYGKVMSIPDSLILHYFELVTDVSDEEVEEFRQALDRETVNPMELKKRLAREIVAQLYSKKAASEAEEHFAKVVQKKELPEEIPEFRIPLRKMETPISIGTKAFRVGRKAETFKVGRRAEVRGKPATTFRVGKKDEKLKVGRRAEVHGKPATVVRGRVVHDISRIIVTTGQARSRSEANRMITHGAVSIDGKKISSNIAHVKSGSIIKVGKRRFAKVIDTNKKEKGI